jgi:hypothetical protein
MMTAQMMTAQMMTAQMMTAQMMILHKRVHGQDAQTFTPPRT